MVIFDQPHDDSARLILAAPDEGRRVDGGFLRAIDRGSMTDLLWLPAVARRHLTASGAVPDLCTGLFKPVA